MVRNKMEKFWNRIVTLLLITIGISIVAYFALNTKPNCPSGTIPVLNISGWYCMSGAEPI